MSNFQTTKKKKVPVLFNSRWYLCAEESPCVLYHIWEVWQYFLLKWFQSLQGSWKIKLKLSKNPSICCFSFFLFRLLYLRRSSLRQGRNLAWWLWVWLHLHRPHRGPLRVHGEMPTLRSNPSRLYSGERRQRPVLRAPSVQPRPRHPNTCRDSNPCTWFHSHPTLWLHCQSSAGRLHPLAHARS